MHTRILTLTFALAAFAWLALVSDATAQTPSPPPLATADLEIAHAKVSFLPELDLLVFEQRVRGVAGGTVPSAAGRLDGALDALERDHEFLLQGDVFNKDLLGAWLDWKRTHEVGEERQRPHPYELHLYFDV